MSSQAFLFFQLKYNSHIKKISILKWYNSIHNFVQSSPLPNSRKFSSPQKETMYPSTVTPHFPSSSLWYESQWDHYSGGSQGEVPDPMGWESGATSILGSEDRAYNHRDYSQALKSNGVFFSAF